MTGGVWIAQGVGWLGGSFMTGESTWTVIGAIALGVGALVLNSARRGRQRPGHQ